MIGRAAILVSWLVANVAVADRVAYRVQWTRAAGAETCIESPALFAGVEARLGRPLDATPGDARVVDGRIERTAGGYRAQIIVRDERGGTLGERELEEPSADCRALDAKLTLVIALAIDPDAVARTAPTVTTPTTAVKPTPSQPTMTAVKPSPTTTTAVKPTTSPSPIDSGAAARRSTHSPTPRGAPWHVELGVFGVGAFGVMPGAGTAGGVAVALDVPRVPVVVANGSVWAPDHATVAAGGSRFTRIGGGLAVCPRLFARGRGELAACGGVDIARMTATGMDFDRNARVIDWIVHGVGEAVASWRVGARWRLAAALGGWVPITRPRFVYASGATSVLVYEGPAAAASLRIGIAVRF